MLQLKKIVREGNFLIISFWGAKFTVIVSCLHSKFRDYKTIFWSFDNELTESYELIVDEHGKNYDALSRQLWNFLNNNQNENLLIIHVGNLILDSRVQSDNEIKTNSFIEYFSSVGLS